jgi:hypothetical protein
MNSAVILAKVHAAWQTFIDQTTLIAPNITSSLTFQSIPAPPSDLSRANSLGFEIDSTPQKDLVLILVSNFWDERSLSSEVQVATARLLARIESLAEEEDLLQEFIYENYASGFQAPLQSTGSLEFFREVAAKYDPSGMFQKQARGGWKLY